MKGMGQAWNPFMSRAAKTAIILLCVSLCLAGTFLASGVCERREPQKASAIPIRNHEVVRRIWIQV